MNRPLKFKVWDSVNQRWVREFDYISLDGEYIYNASFRNINNIEKRKLIVVQFTGIFDKDGKEIWQGDIRREEIEHDLGDDVYYYVCKWMPEICSFVWMDYGDTVTDWQKEIDIEWPCTVKKEESHLYKICGNIFENPELL